MIEESTKINHCSFCGTSKESVKKLVVGESVAICSDCIELCQDLIVDELSENQENEDKKDVEYDPQSIK